MAPRRPALQGATRVISTGSAGWGMSATAPSPRRTRTASIDTSTWSRPATRSSRSSLRARSPRRSPDSDSCWDRCARHEPCERSERVMQKQAPSAGRIMVAVGFTLSCFALLLFLWVTFGGPIPFKPESYRFTADFPEAITLQKEADVRIGGVSVGKVKQLSLAPDSECQKDAATCNSTRATIEISPQYAPISSDAQAILRQKTLLGETDVEITPGSQVQPGQPDSTSVQSSP